MIIAKAFLSLLNKSREYITFQKLDSREFWQYCFSHDKSATTPLFNGPSVSSSGSDKVHLFDEIFPDHSNFDGLDSSLYAFASKIKLYKNFAIPAN